MSVQIHGSATEKRDHTIYLLPTEAERVIVGFGDFEVPFGQQQQKRAGIIAHAIMPPSKKKIRVLQQPEPITIDTATFMWTQAIFDQYAGNNNQYREVIFAIHELRQDGDKLLRKAYMLGNVDNRGWICWGGRYQPANMRQAHFNYFNRGFGGAYSPGVYHKCPKSSEPVNPYNQLKCDCQCCRFRCGGCYYTGVNARNKLAERYHEFLRNYNGDNIVYPWEPFEPQLKNALVGRRQEAFYVDSSGKDPVLGWAKITDEGWKVMIPGQNPKIFKNIFVANVYNH